MKCTIFYSWQSDLPNKTNRNFIETCIKQAIKEINIDIELQLEIIFDRDTVDITGTPDITDTIFSKIEKADLFICDISIINYLTENRKTPNPNVLIELGYAAKSLGWEKVICLFNSQYGCIDHGCSNFLL